MIGDGKAGGAMVGFSDHRRPLYFLNIVDKILDMVLGDIWDLEVTNFIGTSLSQGIGGFQLEQNPFGRISTDWSLPIPPDRILVVFS